MHGPRPRDWNRFEREMRIWGRRFERDMRAMGEDIEADMNAAGRTHRRGWGGWCGPGAAWMFDWDDVDARRRARAGERAARRMARRAARHAARGASRGAARWASHGGFWAWWWLVFPLFFIGRNALEDAGGWTGLGSGLASWAAGSLSFTPAAPLARLVSEAIGVSYLEGFTLLALAGAVTAGAAWFGWRFGRPEGARPTP
jgi:hypothetical protein